MKGYWGKGLRTEMNVTLAWVKRFPSAESCILEYACSSSVQVYADGVLAAFGPARAAHGMARLMRCELPPCKTVAVLVAGYNCNSFWLIDEPPFFAARLLRGGEEYGPESFSCVRLHDRLQRVARFSYQRPFSEAYIFDGSRAALLSGDVSGYAPAEQEEVPLPRLLPCETSAPALRYHRADEVIEEGTVGIDASAPVWRNRMHLNVGKELKGFPVSEWECAPTDEASRFVYNAGGEGKYRLYDFGRAITGFVKLRIRARGSAQVYILFDEIIWEEQENAPKGCRNICFYRNETGNVVKWSLRPGEYVLTAFEPYSMRYLKVVVFGDADAEEAGITDYENPDADAFRFDVADGKMQAILEAAVNTFRQNAVDLLTDCPSRERAGWLSDSWFSSASERLFTGKNLAENAFLENYAHASRRGLPAGMLPMCYPADSYDGTYIPNWAMWYILEVYENAKACGRKNAEEARANIEGLLSFFGRYENEYGLLEDLESWVFVEWSAANDPSHICGVNLPSNMCWAKCLDCIAELYDMPALHRKAERLRGAILELGFDGAFFADNCVRGEDGKLHSTGLKTEVCQYYAFWFGVATPRSHPALYAELIEKFGPFRAEGYRPEIAPPNAMYGIYMRLDLLKREGDIGRLARECVAYFYKMAERTGTLWEHNAPYASCIHGFASYAATWLVYVLTGWNGERFEEKFLGTECSFELPRPDGTLRVRVAEGRRSIEKA